ncbi:MAG: aldo/keto reductase [Chloroflexota bacterium]
MSRNQALLAPRLGLGTWKMGSSPGERNAEVAALRAGIEMGVNLIDTAEMYASGGAEEVTGEAISHYDRESLYIVTKVLPSNASREGTIQACEASLKRLGIDQVDLYLLHWVSSYPLAGTVEAFETLAERGLIKSWGVSNFDVYEMQDLYRLDAGGNCGVNQVYYSLGQRGVEFDLLPWQVEHDVATMAYCPLDKGRLPKDMRLLSIAEKHRATIAQIGLAYLMQNPSVVPIPKSSNVSRVKENANARSIRLDKEDLDQLDAIYPPPERAMPLFTS